MDNMFTSDEVIEKLKELERSLLKRVFEDSYCDSLRTYDLIRHLEDKDRELGLRDSAEFSRLMDGLRKLSSSIGSHINGKHGERLAFKTLRCLRGENLIIPNVALENGGSFEEFDHIVITGAGVFVIEVKNYSHNAVIDESGVLRCGRVAYNVGERVLEKTQALWDAIRFASEGFLSIDDIHCVLLFVNDEHKVSDYFHRVPVKRRGQIVYDINEATKNGRSLSKEEMRRIKAAIVTRSVPALFGMPVDSQELIASLDVVLDLIEDKTKRGNAEAFVEMSADPEPQTEVAKPHGDRTPGWIPWVAAAVAATAATALGAIGLSGYGRRPINA